ncbi:NAD(P)H-binding protein [Streptomyces sp. URMC 124]|uniref:NAD(P)H-binding protein n=1 Tax=Streptomyces sp. URMC 124 TaxID=3423405 RepID=UPI003F1D6690
MTTGEQATGVRAADGAPAAAGAEGAKGAEGPEGARGGPSARSAAAAEPAGGRPPRIVVTGASGTVGSRVARLLVAAGCEVTSLTRDPARAADDGLAGRITGADLADGPGLARALAGADTVLMITFDPLRPAHDANLLAAAHAGGVRHVVKLSALAVTDPGAQDLITRWQRDCEELVRTSGLDWTLLRPRAFMSNTLGWAPSVRSRRAVRALYGTGRNSCIDPQDVAEAAARVLTRPGAHAGRAYALTGPQALSARDQTRRLAAVLEEPLRFEELTERQALEAWRARHPEPLALALLAGARRQHEGAKSGLADGVAQVTGRAPGTYEAWAARHAASFRAAPIP